MKDDCWIERVFNSQCPHCFIKNQLTKAVDGTDVIPKKGDVLVCLDCTRPGVVTGEKPRRLRKPTTAELKELAANTDYLMAVAAIRSVKEK